MPKIDVLNMAGEKVSELELNEAVFAVEPNTSAMHIAVVNYLANQRQGTQSTLTRSEVSGGGKKPWRQKGTGRARQGSTRSPQWYHGGVAHGPKPRSYRFTINKKVKRLAIKSAFSSKVAENEMIVIDEIKFEEPKTKDMVKMLEAVKAGKKPLIIMSEKDENVVKSAANIPGVMTALVSTMNVYDIINHTDFIVTKDAINKIEEVYS